MPTVIGAQADPTRRDDEVITQIVPLQYAPADRIAATLRPFVQGGNLVVQGSLLIVTDTAANVARLLQIVSVLDVEVATDELRLIRSGSPTRSSWGGSSTSSSPGRRVRTPSVAVPAVPAPPAPPAPRRGTRGAQRARRRPGSGRP